MSSQLFPNWVISWTFQNYHLLFCANPAAGLRSAPVGRVPRQTLVFRSCMSVTESGTCAIIRVARAGKVAARSEATAAGCGSLVLLILQQPQSTVASHFSFFTACGNDSLETFRPTRCVCVCSPALHGHHFT